MTRIETDALLGADPSVSVSSVFPFFLDVCGAGIGSGTLTEIPRLASLARNDNLLPVIPSEARNLSQPDRMRFLDSLRSLGMTGGAARQLSPPDMLAGYPSAAMVSSASHRSIIAATSASTAASRALAATTAAPSRASAGSASEV